ncbi:MAG: hypothetical protein WAT17_02225 [Candidatus Saccharimonadales bacterium]|jgi:Tfp pilus assembly protein PilO
METSKPAVTGFKKRQQIQQANRVVFIWVTIAAAALAITVVMAQFMVKQFMFNNVVIGAEVKANSTVQKNITVYDSLKSEVAKLYSNPMLGKLKADPSDTALQVVIDAMPTEDDRVALLASLQQIIFAKSGVHVEAISFNDVAATPSAATPGTSASSGVIAIPFTAKVTGNYDSIKQLLVDLNHSIRPIKVTSLKITGASNSMTAELEAETYFAAPDTVDLKQETKKP